MDTGVLAKSVHIALKTNLFYLLPPVKVVFCERLAILAHPVKERVIFADKEQQDGRAAPKKNEESRQGKNPEYPCL